MNEKIAFEIDSTTAIHLPMSERVLDKLADILLATDEILGMLRVPERVPDSTSESVEASMQRVYEQVNELMMKLSD